MFAVPLALDLSVEETGREPDARQLAGMHWTVRLTAKLLREINLEARSGWAPYLKVSHRRPALAAPGLLLID